MSRNFCRTEDISPKSKLRKEKNRPAKHQRRLSLAETDPATAIPQARGLNLVLGADANDSTSRATVRDLSCYLVEPAVTSLKQFSSVLRPGPTTVSGVVCVLCQFSHKRKERRGLADEEPHVR
jgi:hypothetical protein